MVVPSSAETTLPLSFILKVTLQLKMAAGDSAITSTLKHQEEGLAPSSWVNYF